MNTDTGELKDYGEIFGDKLEGMSSREQQEELELKNFVPIDPIDLTRKQRRERKVSLNDHRSKLGVQLTAIQQRKKLFGK